MVMNKILGHSIISNYICIVVTGVLFISSCSYSNQPETSREANHKHKFKKDAVISETDGSSKIIDKNGATDKFEKYIAMDMFKKYIATVASEVTIGWSRSNEVWPGSNFDELALVINNGDPNIAWLITTNSVKRLSSEDAQHLYKPGLFAFDTYKGRGIVVMNDKKTFSLYQKIAKFGLPSDVNSSIFYGGISYNASTLRKKLTKFNRAYRKTHIQHSITELGTTYVFTLASHEAFHYYVQSKKNNWVMPNSHSSKTGDRFSHYPASPEPRAYRSLMYGNLVDAYYSAENRQDYLSAAAYWYDKWRSDYPQEYEDSAFIDNVEGTARYFDMAVTALLIQKLNPELSFSEAAIIQLNDSRYSSIANKLKRPASTPLKTSLSGESYILGAIAGLLAKEMKLGWQKQMPLFNRPVEIVLKGVKPTKQNLPLEILSKAESYIRRKEKLLDDVIPAFYNRVIEPQKNDIYVFFNATSTLGSFRRKGTYLPKNSLNNMLVSVGLTAQYKLKKGFAKLTRAVVGHEADPPCATTEKRSTPKTLLIVVPEGAVQKNNGRIKIKIKNVSIDIAKSSMSETKFLERRALCLAGE